MNVTLQSTAQRSNTSSHDKRAQQDHFSSADFAHVPAHIVPQLERLIHKDVLRSGVHADMQFSSERQHMVRTVDLPSRALSVTLGGLDPRQATRMHRHNYETVLYILRGSGKSTIETQQVDWQAGDAVYIPAWAWHQHINTSEEADALYLACENAPMLQNLGVAVREER